MDLLKIRKIQKLHFHFQTFFSKFPFKGKILVSQNSNLEFWPTWPTPLAIVCNACLLCTGAHLIRIYNQVEKVKGENQGISTFEYM